MFHVTPDGSVLDSDGRIVFFSEDRFISDIANDDCCFICGAQPNAVRFNNEHVIPDWILRRFGLHGKQLGLPNQAFLRYGSLTVPCCVTCNSEMGDLFETPISALFAGGIDAVSQELKDHGPWRLFCWMALIFLKAHLKNKYLNYHRDRRKGDIRIAEIHSWEELYHLHCVARAFHSRATMEAEVVGSFCVFQAKVRPHLEGFDFVDLTAAQTMLLRIDDVALIAVFNDSQAALSVANEDFERKISGPLSPIQLREITARLASINLHVENRTEFFSEFDTFAESYKIRAKRPVGVLLRPWDDDLHGQIMYTASQGMLRLIADGGELETLVKTGRYTFLTTPEGSFDANSMELSSISTDSSRPHVEEDA